jgi:hypothetical protein
MNIGDFLKGLAIDTWYKALMYLGGAVFAVSLFVDVKGIGNVNAQLLSSGCFLLGLGEWKNHKVQSMNLESLTTHALNADVRLHGNRRNNK